MSLNLENIASSLAAPASDHSAATNSRPTATPPPTRQSRQSRPSRRTSQSSHTSQNTALKKKVQKVLTSANRKRNTPPCFTCRGRLRAGHKQKCITAPEGGRKCAFCIGRGDSCVFPHDSQAFSDNDDDGEGGDGSEGDEGGRAVKWTRRDAATARARHPLNQPLAMNPRQELYDTLTILPSARGTSGATVEIGGKSYTVSSFPKPQNQKEVLELGGKRYATFLVLLTSPSGNTTTMNAALLIPRGFINTNAARTAAGQPFKHSVKGIVEYNRELLAKTEVEVAGRVYPTFRVVVDGTKMLGALLVSEGWGEKGRDEKKRGQDQVDGEDEDGGEDSEEGHEGERVVVVPSWTVID